MDLNPRHRRERKIAHDLVKEFMANVTTETGAPQELLAHHFGLVCKKFDFIPDEAAALRVLAHASKEIAGKRHKADRLLVEILGGKHGH
jgi:hypothetical protein